VSSSTTTRFLRITERPHAMNGTGVATPSAQICTESAKGVPNSPGSKCTV
jgi:hypothetical protein